MRFPRRRFLELAMGAAASPVASRFGRAQAQGTVKIGALLPMTGPQQSTGVQVAAGIRLYMAQRGDAVAGKSIEVILKDDAGVADNSKRLAQEMIVNGEVISSSASGSPRPPSRYRRWPPRPNFHKVVMAASTSSITERSPYVVRTSATLGQSSVIMADWALKNGIKNVVSIVSDYAPGIDAENFFKREFTKGGGKVTEFIRTPFANPDFAPFLQRARDEKPDAIFVFVPAASPRVFAPIPGARPRQGRHSDHRPWRRDRRRCPQ